MFSLDPTILVSLAAFAGFLLGALLIGFARRGQLRRLKDELDLTNLQLEDQAETLDALRQQLAVARVHFPSDTESLDVAARISTLEDTLEQRTLELRIIRQDYELETRLLKQEVEHTRKQLEEERTALVHGRSTLEYARDILARQSERLGSLEQTPDRDKIVPAAAERPMRKRYSHAPIAVPAVEAELPLHSDRPAMPHALHAERPVLRSLHNLLEDIPVS